MLTVGCVRRHRTGGRGHALAPRRPPLSRTTGCASSPAPDRPAASLDGVVVEDVATADHRGVDVALFSMGATASRESGKGGRRGSHRHRQLLGLAHGPRLPARGARGQRRRPGSHPEGDRRQPQLHDHGRACRCWRRCTPSAGLLRLIGVDLPGGLGRRPGRDGRARRAGAGRRRQGRRPHPRRDCRGLSRPRRSSRVRIAFNVLPTPAPSSTTRPTRSTSSATRAARSSASPTWRCR